MSMLLLDTKAQKNGFVSSPFVVLFCRLRCQKYVNAKSLHKNRKFYAKCYCIKINFIVWTGIKSKEGENIFASLLPRIVSCTCNSSSHLYLKLSYIKSPVMLFIFQEKSSSKFSIKIAFIQPQLQVISRFSLVSSFLEFQEKEWREEKLGIFRTHIKKTWKAIERK